MLHTCGGMVEVLGEDLQGIGSESIYMASTVSVVWRPAQLTSLDGLAMSVKAGIDMMADGGRVRG